MLLKPLKVLIADDSATGRTLFTHIINGERDLSVVGEATNGKQAVKMTAALRPDVILMDIVMPEMDGLEATSEIMRLTPTPIVVVSANLEEKETNLAFKAISSGALTAIRRPSGPRDPNYPNEVKELLKTLRAMAGVRVIHRRKPEQVVPGRGPKGAPAYSTISPRIVAIVASTGGPSALAEVVGNLPADFPLPVLIVQHITKEFIPSLVGWLQRVTPLKVAIASQGDLPTSSTVYIAPGDTHLRLTKGLRFDLSRAPESTPHIPSGDIFLESVAQAFGGQAIGIVLTGMGEDGARGLRAMCDRGAITLAQDESSSVVYGMPRQAAELGAVRQMLPLSEMAKTLIELVNTSR